MDQSNNRAVPSSMSVQERPEPNNSMDRNHGNINNGNGDVGALIHDHVPAASMNTNCNCKQMGMKEWIVGALHSLDGDTNANAGNINGNSNNAALCSNTAYLTCALEIAHSLIADQISEGKGKVGQEKGEGVFMPTTNATANTTTTTTTTTGHHHSHRSWSEFVTIYVNKSKKKYDASANANVNHPNANANDDVLNVNANNQATGKSEERDEGQSGSADDVTVGLLSDLEPLTEDLQAMLNSIIPDHSAYLEEDDEDQEEFLADMNIMSSLPVHDLEKEMKAHADDGLGCGNEHEAGGPNENTDASETEEAIEYLNISSAKLRMEYESGDSHEQGEERMHIYLLGLVFFELFSGGKRCTLRLPQHRETSSSPASPAVSFSPLNQLSAMNVIDDALGVGDDDDDDDDEIFGDNGNGKGVLNGGAIIDGNNFDSEPMKKRRSTTTEEIDIAVEQLKSLGLPICVCDLIRNMIDCSKGDFSEDETYSSMADVKKDLKYMLDYPHIYLCDFDARHYAIVSSGLQMDIDNGDKLFGRDSEFANLKEIYHRSISKGCECAIVSGVGGVGKTALLHGLIHYAMMTSGDEDGKEGRRGCVYLSGKFDKVQKSQPYSAVASAFNQYCGWLSSRAENESVAGKVSAALKQALGPEDIGKIAKLMPNLFKIIGEDYAGAGGVGLDEGNDVDDDAPKKIRYLLCFFLEIICLSHDSPLILCLDDLQWCDQSSIALINQALMVFDSNHDAGRKFFFLGGCREETESDHPLWKMLSCVGDFGIRTTNIELGCIDKESANLLISTKLKMLPRLTQPLAEIVHHRCKGNPFFLKQLMVELSKEGLLRPSLTRRRWVWDEERIFERELPDDLVEFITNSLKRLTKEVISSLCTLSCFGASTDCSLVEKLEDETGINLSSSLNTAVAEGFLNRKSETYSFVHDRVQEAVYNVLKPKEHCLHHYKYGMALSTIATRDNDDGLLLIAVEQINLSECKIFHDADSEQGLKAAKLSLLAGKVAMGMSDLFSAYGFFNHGISYLNKGHWENHYELTLELYNGAAECAFANNGIQHANLETLICQVGLHARCFDDKMHALHITLRVLLYKGQMQAAIEHAFDGLSQLGEAFPKEFAPSNVTQSLGKTKAMLENLSDEDLINYKILHDNQRIDMAIKFLVRLSEAMYHARPYDQPVITMRIVELSLVHGLSPLSPLGFTLYGSFLASIGDVRGGYRFAKISRALLDRLGLASSRGEVFAYSAQIMACVEPIQSVAMLSDHDYDATMAAGSTGFALMIACFLSCFYFWGGEKLSKTKNQLEELVGLLNHHKNLMLLSFVIHHRRTVLTLHGTSVETPRKSANDLSMDSSVGKAASFQMMLTAFISRRYDKAKSFASKFSKFDNGDKFFAIHGIMQTFYYGLVSYWIGREENSSEWKSKGDESRLAMQNMADISLWNFQHKFYLLSAEEQFCERNFEMAEMLYDESILSARNHKFVNDEALANELAGTFYLETGRRKKSIHYLTQSLHCYIEWEAHAKVKSLKTHLEKVMASASS